MATIELREVRKQYRQGATTVTALDGVSLRFEAGEFAAVVGRSGSGKTTLLDVAGLLLRPSSGSVLIDGVDTARLRDGQRADLRSRRIGFIFQEYNLLPALTLLTTSSSRSATAAATSATAALVRWSCWRWSGWASASATGRTSFRAGSSSASPSPGL